MKPSTTSQLPFVSVIIPTFRDGDRLSLCLDALSHQTYPQSRFEVIVVDNCPDDGRSIPTYGNIQICSELQPGSYAARNKGLTLAKGEIFAFTDSDCRPAKKWIETAVDYFLNNPSVDFIGGKIDLCSASSQANCFELYESAFAFPQHEIRNGRPYSVTANMFARKTAFQTTGMFDSNSFSGEDVRWGKRAVGAGLKIGYSERTVVIHPARKTLGEILKKKTRTAGGSYLSKKHKRQVMLIIITGFIPPLHRCFRITPDRGLTILGILTAILLEYFFRIFRSVLFLLFLTKLKTPKVR